MPGFGLDMETQELDADGTLCYECKQPLEGRMVQWFLFESISLAPMPTKFKVCIPCFKKENE